jgi:hypothetical protein
MAHFSGFLPRWSLPYHTLSMDEPGNCLFTIPLLSRRHQGFLPCCDRSERVADSFVMVM